MAQLLVETRWPRRGLSLTRTPHKYGATRLSVDSSRCACRARAKTRVWPLLPERDGKAEAKGILDNCKREQLQCPQSLSLTCGLVSALWVSQLLSPPSTWIETTRTHLRSTGSISLLLCFVGLAVFPRPARCFSLSLVCVDRVMEYFVLPKFSCLLRVR